MKTVSAKWGARRRAGGAAVLALLGLFAGCGPSNNNATVSGKVTYKGQPLTGGTIKLYSDAPPLPGAGDQTFRIAIKPDGTFSATNVPTGANTVTIETGPVKQASQGPAIDPKTGLPFGTQPPPGYDPSRFKPPTSSEAGNVPIPGKYADPRTSGLTWDIKAGPNPRDFELTD